MIDGATNTVIATVTAGSLPYGVAVNSVTNQIYVPITAATMSLAAPTAGR